MIPRGRVHGPPRVDFTFWSTLWSALNVAGALSMVVSVACGSGDGVGAVPDPDPEAVARGQAHYAELCAFCHGQAGEGYVSDGANALAHPDFLATATDGFLEAAVAQGRPGSPMSGWGQGWGGPLDAQGVSDVVAFMRSWQTVPSREPTPPPAIEASAIRGEGLYDTLCADCHGEGGQGGLYPSVANPVLLDTASDAFLYEALAFGRDGTPMPAFAGALTPTNLADLVALMRSWQADPAAPPPALPPAALGGGAVVVHPDGEDPPFTPSGGGDDRFVPAAEVAAALEARQRMVLLDARSAGDYVADHISGAVSVPFYDVEGRLGELPQDTWIVCYCGCPHAASGQAFDALVAAGYTRVAVLDEGYFHWKDMGYPVTSGPLP